MNSDGIAALVGEFPLKCLGIISFQMCILSLSIQLFMSFADSFSVFCSNSSGRKSHSNARDLMERRHLDGSECESIQTELIKIQLVYKSVYYAAYATCAVRMTAFQL